MAKKKRYDAIVVGGGHNGLVNGAYLAKGMVLIKACSIWNMAGLVRTSFPLKMDFYIVRLYRASARAWRWAVLLSPDFWGEINGEPIHAPLEDALIHFPRAVSANRARLAGQAVGDRHT